jgi:hypothetical protein
MKEFVNDIQNLIVKHWGKLIVTILVVGLIANYKDAMKGFKEGYNSARHTQTK